MNLVILLFFLTLPGALLQYCSPCRGCCSFSEDSLCKCDKECLMYKDCCGENLHRSTSLSESIHFDLLFNVSLNCVSPNTIFTTVVGDQKHFYMITSCPYSWVDPINLNISSHCGMPDVTKPPVTDLRTGLVYKNEYCALCNGVTKMAAWAPQLDCTDSVHKLTAEISSDEINGTDLIISECNVTSFLPPRRKRSSKSPRLCVPYHKKCLTYRDLAYASKKITKKDYVHLLRQCSSDIINPVRGISGDKVFKNRACAMCNAEDNVECAVISNTLDKRKSTQEATPFHKAYVEFHEPIQSFDFTLILRCLVGSNKKVKFRMSCPQGEIPVGLTCRRTLCPEGFRKTGRKCAYADYLTVLLHSTTPNCLNHIAIVSNETYTDLGNSTIVLNQTGDLMEVLDYNEVGHPIVCQDNSSIELTVLNCNSALVSLDVSEYTDFMNDTILVESKLIPVKFHDIYNRPLVCPDLLKPQPSPLPGIQLITFVGCILSVLGAVAVIVTYSIFDDLHTFPGLALLNVCITVLFTSSMGILRALIIQYYPFSGVCSILAVFIHYFYLAQFSWMSLFSFEIMKGFYQVSSGEDNSRQKKCKLILLYLFIGWVLPLLINSISATLHFTTSSMLYGVKGEKEIAECWINHYESFIIAFLLPLVLSLVCNITFMAVTTLLLCTAEEDRSEVDKSNIAIRIRMWIAIFAITALTWVFGFFAILDKVEWMWYIFVVLNSTQGFRISLAFILTKKVYNLYANLIRKRLQITLINSSKVKKVHRFLQSRQEEPMKLEMVLVPLMSNNNEN